MTLNDYERNPWLQKLDEIQYGRQDASLSDTARGYLNVLSIYNSTNYGHEHLFQLYLLRRWPLKYTGGPRFDASF